MEQMLCKLFSVSVTISNDTVRLFEKHLLTIENVDT